MLKIGIVCYAENTGLGSQSLQFYKHLNPARTMLLDRSGSEDYEFYPERYGSDVMIVQSLPEMQVVDQFIQGLDVVLAMETLPTNYMTHACKQAGIKTVVVPNFEYYANHRNNNVLRPDALLAPSLWRMDEYKDPVVYIPTPVEPHLRDMPETATNFLHVGGKPIGGDRNGTEIFLKSLEQITAKITATVTSQNAEYMQSLTRSLVLPANVRLNVITSNVHDWQTLYAKQHALVMPRRFGGQCMPVNEALGFGMPVIMPAIQPNVQWLPPEWLLPAEKTGERKMGVMINIFTADDEVLAQKIDLWATDKANYSSATDKAKILAKNYSWDELTPKFMRILEQVCYH